MFHSLPEQMAHVPNLQQLVSQIQVMGGSGVLPASEIPQIFTEQLLCTTGGRHSSGLCCAVQHPSQKAL